MHDAIVVEEGKINAINNTILEEPVEVIDLVGSGVNKKKEEETGEDLASDDMNEEPVFEVIDLTSRLNDEVENDEDLVNQILSNLEILKSRGSAEELNNDPSDIMDLLFEEVEDTSEDGLKDHDDDDDSEALLNALMQKMRETEAGFATPTPRKRRRRRKKKNNINKRSKNSKKRTRRIRINHPKFGDKIKDVILYYRR